MKMLMIVTTIIAAIELSGCSKGKSSSVSSLSALTTKDKPTSMQPTKDEDVPIFERSGTVVNLLTSSGKHIGAFDASQLVDIDENYRVVNAPSDQVEKDIAIIQAGIKGAFHTGLFGMASKSIDTEEGRAMIKAVKFARPFKVQYAEEGAENYYVAGILLGRNLIAASEVWETPNGYKSGGIILLGDARKVLSVESNFKCLSRSELPSVIGNQLSRYSVQAAGDEIKRVKFATNQKTGGMLGFLWKVRSDNQDFYIGIDGKVYSPSGAQRGLRIGDKLPKNTRVELAEIK